MRAQDEFENAKAIDLGGPDGSKPGDWEKYWDGFGNGVLFGLIAVIFAWILSSLDYTEIVRYIG